MSLLNSIKPLIQICQFFGLAPFSMNQNTSRWELNSGLEILSIIYIIFDAVFLICGIVFNDQFINYKTSSIHIILHGLFLLLNHLHAMFSLVELFIKRKQNVELLNEIERLDELFKQHLNMHVDYVRLKKSCRNFFIFWICEVFGVILSYPFLYYQTKNPRVIRYFCMFIPAYALCKLSFVYSMVLVSSIDECLNVLNKYLKSITKKNGYYIRDFVANQNELNRRGITYIKENKNDLSAKTLLFLRTSYSKIWAASIQTRRVMYWALPFGCANEFYVLTFCSYLVFINLLRSNSMIAFYTLLLIAMISDLVNILSVAHICSRAAESVSHIDSTYGANLQKILLKH